MITASVRDNIEDFKVEQSKLSNKDYYMNFNTLRFLMKLDINFSNVKTLDGNIIVNDYRMKLYIIKLEDFTNILRWFLKLPHFEAGDNLDIYIYKESIIDPKVYKQFSNIKGYGFDSHLLNVSLCIIDETINDEPTRVGLLNMISNVSEDEPLIMAESLNTDAKYSDLSLILYNEDYYTLKIKNINRIKYKELLYKIFDSGAHLIKIDSDDEDDFLIDKEYKNDELSIQNIIKIVLVSVVYPKVSDHIGLHEFLVNTGICDNIIEAEIFLSESEN